MPRTQPGWLPRSLAYNLTCGARILAAGGVLGTVYTGELVEEVQIAGRTGVVPKISGQAWITGFSNWVLDPEDPFPNGYTLGDIWAPAANENVIADNAPASGTVRTQMEAPV